MIPAPAAFVKPAKREQWEADHKAVQHADLRDYCTKLMGDAMKAGGGTWQGMAPARIEQARNAACSDPEDVTDEERNALSEYIEKGGNVWGL